MTDLATLRRGRKSFEQRAWAESYRLLRDADCDAPLDAEDLERLAIAAHLVGRDDECETVTARAHQAFLDRGDREGAARAAFWLGFSLMEPGGSLEAAPVDSWTIASNWSLLRQQIQLESRRLSTLARDRRVGAPVALTIPMSRVQGTSTRSSVQGKPMHGPKCVDGFRTGTEAVQRIANHAF